MGHLVKIIQLIVLSFLAFQSMAQANDNGDVNAANYSKYRRAIPTIYYLPFYNLDNNYQCGKEKKVWIYEPSKEPIANICLSHYQNCRMQGTCVLIKGGARVMVNYRRDFYFAPVDQKRCPYGFGPKNVCLEPYYSVAADPRYHQQGDVLYMHELRGLELPNGQTHNGFVVVRDTGGAIKGPDRFDLYIGFSLPTDSYDPFVQKDFGDKKTLIRYAKVISQEIKDKVLKKRNYPYTPPEF